MTKHTPTIDEWQAAVNACETLEQLLEVLRGIQRLEFERRAAVWDHVMDALPTFGGEAPDDTDEIWSWDEARLLVSDGIGGFEIVHGDPAAT